MQLNLLSTFAEEKEDIRQVMTELSKTCHACRLSFLHPNNRGIIWRGNVDAKIAILAEAPGDKETEMGRPLIGNSGKEFERWTRTINFDIDKLSLVTNIVQCQPAKAMKEGHMQQNPPDKDEIAACFGPRCMRVLKAMPNLECIMTVGWIAAKAVLGGSPSTKTHEGQWFESSLFPGIPVFCVIHPSYVLRNPDPSKTNRAMDCMIRFKAEYLQTGKVRALALKIKEERESNNYDF